MLDIFKKSRLKQKKDIFPIVIDFRERNSMVISELSALKVPFEFRQLPVGDYLVAGTIIERKSLHDLKSSIINKRIFEQVKQLKAQTAPALLIIELESGKSIYEEIIHENALRGFFLSLAKDERIPFILSQNEKDTAKYICLLNQKSKKKHLSLRPSRIVESKEERVQFILEGFPGIGPATVKKLMEKFGSLRKIINASEEDLKDILGKKAEKFRELLD